MCTITNFQYQINFRNEQLRQGTVGKVLAAKIISNFQSLYISNNEYLNEMKTMLLATMCPIH